MKKILALGLASLTLVLMCEQQASAWLNWKFGAGINMNWQSGGNNFLWGAFRNGQPPGPDCCPPGPHGCPGGHPHALPYGPGGTRTQSFPGFTPYGNSDFQYFGRNQQNQGDPSQLPPTVPSTSGYGYRPVSYTPAYQYPYNYGQVPAYWYGR